ncbi:preprotein translocase subunit YajC [Leucobacter denitrificans]|uniref:Preprotein translocase subunit YajC n=1 Tax=Leucobacter denitrificans TaxID=683042 RepID=A0A7G9S5H6_9MICO|nr:preprotein translocase subunit YajC [Leucobacter denitrificans]QNN63101.1 preprotein translocase subunit YajC [Leucobacter denitrificans]
MDPMTLIMLGLIALLIFFMFRNGRKRRAQMEEMQNNMLPGAEVMLQSGIFATIESIDEEANRVTVSSGSSTLVVHRNAIGQVVTPVDASVEDTEQSAALAPDDDPEFGERMNVADPTIEDVVTDGGIEVNDASDDTPSNPQGNSDDKNSDKE